jgi:hypothetical protein
LLRSDESFAFKSGAIKKTAPAEREEGFGYAPRRSIRISGGAVATEANPILGGERDFEELSTWQASRTSAKP